MSDIKKSDRNTRLDPLVADWGDSLKFSKPKVGLKRVTVGGGTPNVVHSRLRRHYIAVANNNVPAQIEHDKNLRKDRTMAISVCAKGPVTVGYITHDGHLTYLENVVEVLFEDISKITSADLSILASGGQPLDSLLNEGDLLVVRWSP